MMSALLPQTASVMLAGALLLAGAVTALSAGSVTKRLVGLLLALLAALIAATALGAPSPLLTAATAVALGYGVIGAALLVRLQEAYASSETVEIDAADARDDAVEPGA